MTSTRSLRIVAAATLSALTLTLAACGDDSDSDSDATTATTDGAADTTTAATDAPESTDAAAPSDTTDDTGTVAAGAMDRDAFVAAGVASLGMPDESGECLVEAVIDGAGFDTIEESGITPAEFWQSSAPLADIGLTEESDEIDDIADNIADCDDLIEAFAAGAEESVTDEQLDCMNDGGAQDLIGRVLALSLVGADTTEIDAEGQALGDECGLS
jgi:hypothetical protein